MRAEDLKAILRRQPFQPFRLLVSNGMIYEVRHPEMAWVTKNAVLVGTPPTDSAEQFHEGFAVVTLLHINNLEPLPLAPSPPSSNGPGQAP